VETVGVRSTADHRNHSAWPYTVKGGFMDAVRAARLAVVV
jgi:hypothetical protein